MKTLYIIDSLGLGGAQSVVKGILERQKDNQNIFVFALRKRKIDTKIEHNNILFYNSERKYSFGGLIELKKIIRDKEIDILHCHLFKSQLFGFLLKTIYFPRIKLIQHEHGQIFRKSLYYNLFIYISKKRTDLFIAVSKMTKNKIIKIGKIKENKIEVMYNYVDLVRFSKNFLEEEILRRKNDLNLNQDKFVIGYVGRLNHIKGCDILINALPHLNFDFRCLIVGDGPEKHSLTKRVNDLGLQEKVTFLGYKNATEDIYPLFDIFVMPSRSEASPMSLFESWAAGVIPLVSDIEQFKEFVADKKNGLLFKKGDEHSLAEKLNKIILDQEALASIRAQSHDEVRQYSLNNYIENLDYIYKRL